MRIAAIFACVWLVGAALHAGQQPECVHDSEACHVGECKVWESSRWVCEPETYAVMVIPSKCLTRDKLGPDARLEMNLGADGKPDKKTARLIGSQVTYEKNCGHIEIRRRNLN